MINFSGYSSSSVFAFPLFNIGQDVRYRWPESSCFGRVTDAFSQVPQSFGCWPLQQVLAIRVRRLQYNLIPGNVFPLHQIVTNTDRCHDSCIGLVSNIKFAFCFGKSLLRIQVAHPQHLHQDDGNFLGFIADHAGCGRASSFQRCANC